MVKINAIVSLRPETNGHSLTWRSIGIYISPHAGGGGTEWENVGPFLDLIGTKIVFETRQIGPNRIQSIGQLMVDGAPQGRVTFDGTYRPNH